MTATWTPSIIENDKTQESISSNSGNINSHQETSSSGDSNSATAATDADISTEFDDKLFDNDQPNFQNPGDHATVSCAQRQSMPGEASSDYQANANLQLAGYEQGMQRMINPDSAQFAGYGAVHQNGYNLGYGFKPDEMKQAGYYGQDRTYQQNTEAATNAAVYYGQDRTYQQNTEAATNAADNRKEYCYNLFDLLENKQPNFQYLDNNATVSNDQLQSMSGEASSDYQANENLQQAGYEQDMQRMIFNPNPARFAGYEPPHQNGYNHGYDVKQELGEMKPPARDQRFNQGMQRWQNEMLLQPHENNGLANYWR